MNRTILFGSIRPVEALSWTRRCVLAALGIAALLALPGLSPAASLYSENFETYANASVGPTSFGGFGQINNVGGSPWQVQGGGGGGGIAATTGIDANGVGGSKSFFANWDHSLASSFTFDQETAYGVIAAPGAGTPLSQIQVSLSLYMSGSESSTTPIGVDVQNNGNDFVFTPTLANGVFTTVAFTLNQTTPSGANAFDPTLTSNLRVQFGAGGFGFDANNIVRLDNIVVQTVPEPSALALLGLGACGLGLRRRRRA